jgi:hypothetical protein
MNLAEPIRTALVGSATITSNLPAYLGSYTVFTRQPVPADADFPMILVSSGFQGSEEDGLRDERPLLVRDVLVYGQNDTAANYRVVEDIAFAVRALFHRARTAIVVSGWSVVDIVAQGPSPAPVDDEQTVGRRVELTVRLARQT